MWSLKLETEREILQTLLLYLFTPQMQASSQGLEPIHLPLLRPLGKAPQPHPPSETYTRLSPTPLPGFSLPISIS